MTGPPRGVARRAQGRGRVGYGFLDVVGRRASDAWGTGPWTFRAQDPGRDRHRIPDATSTGPERRTAGARRGRRPSGGAGQARSGPGVSTPAWPRVEPVPNVSLS